MLSRREPSQSLWIHATAHLRPDCPGMTIKRQGLVKEEVDTSATHLHQPLLLEALLDATWRGNL